jgi:ABC-type multidrug transport system permease subunit
MWRRILAIFVARNREFYRDRAGLGWNIFMPILMVLAFAFIFRGEPQDLFKVGVLAASSDDQASLSPFLAIDYVTFIPIADAAAGIAKVERHQIDLLLDLRGSPSYWVSLDAPRGYIAERLLVGAYSRDSATPRRQTVTGAALSYADWVLPGVLAMNVMFSSLWGVGWVIVRYRKNQVLRRLKATPLTALEFLVAQVLSRLAVVTAATVIVYIGADLLLDFPMRGAYLALVLAYVAGALCFISLGLLVAARVRTEELADGILNIISWPMLLLSGVWFSMDGTNPAAQALSQVLPLTHLVTAARRVMIDGAGVIDILPELGLLVGLAVLLLTTAAALFRWE